MPTGNSILDAAGDTPVAQLRNVVPENAADVFVKLEWFNPTCSYKDRSPGILPSISHQVSG